MSRVVHFEIPAVDLQQAVRFYEDVFGWTIQPWPGNEGYVLCTTGDSDQPGINGAIIQREGPVVNTIEVADIDAVAAKAEAHGAEIVVPKQPIHGVGWLVYFKDTEGNIVGLHQSDPSVGH